MIGNRFLGFFEQFNKNSKNHRRNKERIASKIDTVKIPFADNGKSIGQLEKLASKARVMKVDLISKLPLAIGFSN